MLRQQNDGLRARQRVFWSRTHLLSRAQHGRRQNEVISNTHTHTRALIRPHTGALAPSTPLACARRLGSKMSREAALSRLAVLSNQVAVDEGVPELIRYQRQRVARARWG